MLNFDIKINSEVPKYQQIVNGINKALANNSLSNGDALPSINRVCKDYKFSKDTVFKAYNILKDNGVIESVPNKGYFVTSDTKKVLLLLDTFKAYKEVLYHAFINNLPKNVIVDIHFHHYSIDTFKTVLNNGKGNYYKYVVMPFDNIEIGTIFSEFDSEKLLIIDWKIHSHPTNNYLVQDFGNSFIKSLSHATISLKKYQRVVFIYPSFTYHPIESVLFFKDYCRKNNLKFTVVTDVKHFEVVEKHAYISVSDRVLGMFLEQCKEKGLEPGKDVGFLSYNDTPTKKFIYKGISVISTDFKQMGTMAADFISNNESIQAYVPTQLIMRESL